MMIPPGRIGLVLDFDATVKQLDGRVATASGRLLLGALRGRTLCPVTVAASPAPQSPGVTLYPGPFIT